ncbi:hypothetical protein RRU01S_39_00160 [Agrobacterium rubi TR3 = NBRC 13261]|uniref:Chemotaxis protein n=1 Tax=Agrobacterium rubi TR3 = NBRC 13261 TaxID=1368415 RepID=A0A081D3E0_9HYPH|nr:hypothetical protein [Agrobacterium rubi]MBP1881626.1 hypothetical protein [Agrobacterium rubi]GAK73436.1 hypothetical protein RRU01S_39_00160 [Agrobacterium rubi TR3 = NBRC 13261]
MKLLLTQYLAALREREELDVILPDVLSSLGFNVISRPMRGTTQYGVDAAAVGTNPRTGLKSLFLLSIKSGNLTRAQWGEGVQSLRSSLEEILDVYVPNHVALQFQALPIVIAMCFGGNVQENVRAQVTGFTKKHTEKGKIEFEEWNGDHIAELVLAGLMRENFFPRNMQSAFRKSLAFVDEPEICVTHYYALLFQLFESCKGKRGDRIRVARQMYLAAWTVFVWCRDVGNLDAAYQTSATTLLWMWDLSRERLGAKGEGEELGVLVNNMVALFRTVAAAYVQMHVVPYSKTENGLGVSVKSWASVDVNLKLFEALGRVSMHGLWLAYTRQLLLTTKHEVPRAAIDQLDLEIMATLEVVADMIDNNIALTTPIRDDHAIEVMLAALFLHQGGASGYLAGWLGEVSRSSVFSYRTNGDYSCTLRDYPDLAAHPKRADGYREEVTAGSILFPTLAIWLAILGDVDGVRGLGDFHSKHMSHSTWQLWMPDESSELHIYRNTEIHGATVAEIRIASGMESLLEQISSEIEVSVDFVELSAIRYGAWPVILLCSQLYRLPVPLHFWPIQPVGELADIT